MDDVQLPSGSPLDQPPSFDTRPIYFLHIYKSGGTSFCSTAREAGKRVPPGLNCNLARGVSGLSSGEQTKLLRRYEVAANEYDGLPSDSSRLVPVSAVAYVVILRDPPDRLFSHYAAAQVFSRKNQGAFRDLGLLQVPVGTTDSREVPGGRSTKQCLFHDCTFADFLRWLHGRRRNPGLAPARLRLPWARGDFAVRYFVGFDACDYGSCGSEDLELAKRRLRDLFAVVLILEDLQADSNELGWGAMRRAFGWPSREAVRRAGTHRGSDAQSAVAGDSTAAAQLTEAVGRLDIELYSFARDLAHRRAKEAAGALPQKGALRANH